MPKNLFFCLIPKISFSSSCHPGIRPHERGSGRQRHVAARERRVFLRQLHSRAQHGLADKQGRLVLPEELCRKIGLKGEVALVGGRGRFEIWNRDPLETRPRRRNADLPTRRERHWIVTQR